MASCRYSIRTGPIEGPVVLPECPPPTEWRGGWLKLLPLDQLPLLTMIWREAPSDFENAEWILVPDDGVVDVKTTDARAAVPALMNAVVQLVVVPVAGVPRSAERSCPPNEEMFVAATAPKSPVQVVPRSLYAVNVMFPADADELDTKS